MLVPDQLILVIEHETPSEAEMFELLDGDVPVLVDLDEGAVSHTVLGLEMTGSAGVDAMLHVVDPRDPREDDWRPLDSAIRAVLELRLIGGAQ